VAPFDPAGGTIAGNRSKDPSAKAKAKANYKTIQTTKQCKWRKQRS
jgi:hypothetical protein